MPREVFTKVAADANGTWTKHEGNVTFATASLTKGVLHDFSDGLTTWQVTPFGIPLALDGSAITLTDPADGSGIMANLDLSGANNQGSAITDIRYRTSGTGDGVSFGAAISGDYLIPISDPNVTLDELASLEFALANAASATETPAYNWSVAKTATPTGSGPVNLLQNPNFVDSTGWLLGAGMSIADNKLTFSGTSNVFLQMETGVQLAAPLIAGAQYRLTATVANWTSGTARFYLQKNDGTTATSSLNITGNGTFSSGLVTQPDPPKTGNANLLRGEGTPIFSITELFLEYI